MPRVTTDPPHRSTPRGFDAVVVLSSMGGAESLREVFQNLPPFVSVPIVVLQHRTTKPNPQMAAMLGSVLRRTGSSMVARYVEDGDRLDGPEVLVVPGGHTLDVSDEVLAMRPMATRDRPGDHLLHQLVADGDRRVLAVVLSGLLDDGASGIGAVKAGGGSVIVQEPATARATSMPNAALATGFVDLVLDPARIGAAIVAYTMAPGAAALLRSAPPPWARAIPA